MIFPMTLAAQYCCCCHSPDYRALKKVFMEKFPDYYDAFMDVMEANNKLSGCCMFVMKYEDFDKYCEWLFSVLAEVEPFIDYQYYDEYQMRVFGFMAERLLDVYIRKNKIKAKHFNFYFYGEREDSKNPIIKCLIAVRGFLYACKTGLAMFLLNLSLHSRKLNKQSPKKP